jgi:glycosyltransferase
MRVSIITVCYNSENFLSDTIRSVLAQTHPDIEYIIVDGQSEDNTVEIIKSFGPKITKWISEPDKGLYDALNKGIALATGDLVGFLHSDDIFADNNVIEKVVESMAHVKADAVYGDIRFVDQINVQKLLTNRKSGKYHLWKLYLGWSPPHPTFYMKRELYLKYGAFDLSFEIAADYDSLLRYLVRHKIRTTYLPYVMVKMRVGGVSNRTMKTISSKWREDYRVMKKNDFGNLLTLFIKSMRPIAHFYKSPKYLFN